MNRTIFDRVVSAEGYTAFRKGGSPNFSDLLLDRQETIRLLTGEPRDAFRQDAPGPEVEGLLAERIGTDIPALTRISVVEADDTESRVRHATVSTESGSATTGAIDAAVGGKGVTFQIDAHDAPKTGVYTNLDKDLWARPNLGGQIVERLITHEYRLEIENQIINGAGSSSDNWEGILNASGINSYARDTTNSESRLSAITNGVEAIQIDGFGLDGDLTVLLHPTDLQTLFSDTASADAVSAVFGALGLTPFASNALTQGTAVVGQFSEYVHTIAGGVMLTSSNQVDDFFLKGHITVKIESIGYGAVRSPEAFAQVTSL
jgi:hypothetical protein